MPRRSLRRTRRTVAVTLATGVALAGAGGAADAAAAPKIVVKGGVTQPVFSYADAIRAAPRRLIAGVHPDRGGSADLARRINAARDLLLGRRA